MMLCPWCDGKADASFVDIGIGAQQVSAAQCGTCGASQYAHSDKREDMSAEEWHRGWWKGPDTDDYLVYYRDKERSYNAREWRHKLLGWTPGDVQRFYFQRLDVMTDLHGVAHAGWVSRDSADTHTHIRTRCGARLHVVGPDQRTVTCVDCVTLL